MGHAVARQHECGRDKTTRVYAAMLPLSVDDFAEAASILYGLSHAMRAARRSCF
jgi:hypothetical protein